MKDTELQPIVLQTYYDLRHKGRIEWIEEDIPADKFPPVESFGQLARICSQLAEQDLIEWKPSLGSTGEPVGGGGRIRSRGIDIIEGKEKPPVGFVVNHIHNHNSPGANFNFGSGNIHQQAAWLDSVSHQIDVAAATPEEKQKSKSLLAQISENKLLNTILGAAVGELTRAALPK